MSAPLRVVIVGGVAGGMSAATRLRRLDESADIVVFQRGPEVPYANCGLPYYVGGVIEERDALLLQTPESLHRRFRLDVRVRHDVVGIDTVRKTVEVVDLDSGRRSTHPYDRLVLATGARPRGDEPTGA
uniref:NAD(P)/FAD-dependent oxidoreductase n=1 Tax=Salmonella enterica TaxID=28901 RepID=UPI00143D045F|nr:FAD-dependent oxidoreductase [Salmonella enterica subsp. enterica serovar Typhimurium]